ncbi:hypothetical protein ATO6_20575 [Oceanicola sp. 22II-s10i]|uniref:fumarylacetoacetate hydrolase family protein n=1 Tax=Oceanicola sp. 22II-s10i TaxID=1317116 RepID=UPI000B65B830|nr:fumarylacetoacetate hydrolase family protein [Oceanicola sp. 22II-s10i]OWU83029.1 hypothetical protein ATO6_20575 [Oceanicola sp. 22II-s10i]
MASVVYSLCTVRSAGEVVAAIRIGDQLWPLTQVAPDLAVGTRGLMALFDDWDASHAALTAVAARLSANGGDSALDIGEVEVLTPLQYPLKVVCAGTNYFDHIEAAGYPNFSKEGNIPALFMKPPTTALVGPGKTAKYPNGATQFDWEIELGVVMAKRTSRVTQAEALSYVAGYMVTIDFSARDFQRNPKHFKQADLFMGKAFDSACPAGPIFVPAEFVGDPQNLTMKLWRNGKIEQDSNTSKMIWSVAELLEFITSQVTLEPGDLLLTGTPAGTGIETGTYASVGDVVEAEIEHLGRLRVEIY